MDAMQKHTLFIPQGRWAWHAHVSISRALWGHREVQLWKVSATSLLDIVKIDWWRRRRQKGKESILTMSKTNSDSWKSTLTIQSKDTNTALPVFLVADEVVVTVVMLVLFIAQQLKPFAVSFRNACNVFYSFHHSRSNWVFIAFVLAPCVCAGASCIDLPKYKRNILSLLLCYDVKCILICCLPSYHRCRPPDAFLHRQNVGTPQCLRAQ